MYAWIVRHCIFFSRCSVCMFDWISHALIGSPLRSMRRHKTGLIIKIDFFLLIEFLVFSGWFLLWNIYIATRVCVTKLMHCNNTAIEYSSDLVSSSSLLVCNKSPDKLYSKNLNQRCRIVNTVWELFLMVYDSPQQHSCYIIYIVSARRFVFAFGVHITLPTETPLSSLNVAPGAMP